VPKESLSVDSN